MVLGHPPGVGVEALAIGTHLGEHARRRGEVRISDLLPLHPQTRPAGSAPQPVQQPRDGLHGLQQGRRPVAEADGGPVALQIETRFTPAVGRLHLVAVNRLSLSGIDARAVQQETPQHEHFQEVKLLLGDTQGVEGTDVEGA